MRPPAWMEDALCAQVGGDAWFPENGQGAREARTICRACPVATACLEWALANEPGWGVYAGTTQRQRAKARKRRAAA
jgi:WhiB family redox-sensing transcriptional regulator